MKLISALFITTILCCFTPVQAADNDKSEVERISLGYLIALQQMKPDLMVEVMHPQLAKRTSYWDKKNKKSKVHETSYEKMLKYAEDWNKAGDKFPKNPSNRVTILDMQGTMASVKLESDNWYEYLHLAKLDGQWKILNLYWQSHPDRKR